MPDGRPGDHPLTDIVVHGEEPFDRETNARIRRICNGAPPPILAMLNAIVWEWPRVSEEGGAWAQPVEPDRFRRTIEQLERCWRDLGRKGGHDNDPAG